MADSLQVKQEIKQVIQQLLDEVPLTHRQLLVIGTSTSEVAGKVIGTSGSDQIAEALFQGIMEMKKRHGFQIAFQCCEHLNRALVVERETLEQFGYVEVMAVPVPHAGGAMAAYAFRHLTDSVLVEQVQADAGIDIGDTLIGMHLKPVAVPIRTKQKTIGAAHVTVAKTRPKLIGGARAVYVLETCCK